MKSFHPKKGCKYDAIRIDKLVKTYNSRWLSKKLHMRGAYFLFNFGVLRYVVIK